MSNQDVLFELGCEELPSRQVLPLAKAFKSGLEEALKAAKIEFNAIHYFATPRRIALWVQTIASQQAAQTQIRKGPSKQAAFDDSGKPTKALLGFLRGCEASLDDIRFEQTDKGEWVQIEKHLPALETFTLLPELFSQALSSLAIPKPMHWGEQCGPFIRPVHWILALYGERVIPGTYFGIKANRFTYGHRYLAPEQYAIDTPEAYEAILKGAKVIASFETRRELIIEQVQAQAARHGGHALMPEALIDEVTSIVEWPVALSAHFDERFLALPQEVLIESMQQHQKCFALQSKQSRALLPFFVTVANIESEKPDAVIKGNENVMCARLSDAEFFFNQDCKQGLKAFAPMLNQALFQAKLGSLAKQVSRMQGVLPLFIQALGLDETRAKEALSLSQCDLMSGMVGEFPELQGIMGAYYAEKSGHANEVALAIKEQYLPRFAQDSLPTSALGWLLSVLKRLDTMVGIFGIGQKPTGVKDPYKLRRHALALIRLFAMQKHDFSLSTCLKAAFDTFEPSVLNAASLSELKTYILERLPAYFESADISPSCISAVLAVQDDQIYDLVLRVQALSQVEADLKPLLGGAKRVAHILKSTDNKLNEAKLDERLLKAPAERALYEAMLQTETKLQPLRAERDYVACLQLLSALRPAIDAFFEHVMVMVEDEVLKQQRLCLLMRLRKLLFCVADLSYLQ